MWLRVNKRQVQKNKSTGDQGPAAPGKKPQEKDPHKNERASGQEPGEDQEKYHKVPLPSPRQGEDPNRRKYQKIKRKKKPRTVGPAANIYYKKTPKFAKKELTRYGSVLQYR